MRIIVEPITEVKKFIDVNGDYHDNKSDAFRTNYLSAVSAAAIEALGSRASVPDVVDWMLNNFKVGDKDD
jgi:hypothetical protein